MCKASTERASEPGEIESAVFFEVYLQRENRSQERKTTRDRRYDSHGRNRLGRLALRWLEVFLKIEFPILTSAMQVPSPGPFESAT